MSEPALAEIRAHPGFRPAIGAFAQSALDHYLGLSEIFQWVLKDVGRVGITFTAMALHGTEDGLTAASLTAGCRLHAISSPGRVTQYLNRCYQAGEITAAPGRGHWTRQRLRLSPAFFHHFSRRVRDDMTVIRTLAPDITAAMTVTDEEPAYLHYVVCSGLLVAARPDIFSAEASAPRPPYIFGKRDAGMFMLYDLMLAQPSDRSRLLEEAPLSRASLSRRFGVSRAHVNAMLAEAAAAGLLHCPQADRVVFSPVLSDAIERQCAILFQLTRAAALIAMATLPNRPRQN